MYLVYIRYIRYILDKNIHYIICLLYNEYFCLIYNEYLVNVYRTCYKYVQRLLENDLGTKLCSNCYGNEPNRERKSKYHYISAI